jgi:hypothetical protein
LRTGRRRRAGASNENSGSIEALATARAWRTSAACGSRSAPKSICPMTDRVSPCMSAAMSTIWPSLHRSWTRAALRAIVAA